MGGRKRQNLTLDLNSASPKKNKVQNLLTSPDVQMLKLTSPELEKFLSQNPSLATPTPSGFFPKSVTEEQMMYAKGFEEALEKMRRGDEESFNPVCDTSQHSGHSQLRSGRRRPTPTPSGFFPKSVTEE